MDRELGDYFRTQSRFLTAADIEEPVVVEISSLDFEEVPTVQAGQGAKPVLRFRHWERGLILNRVNTTTLDRLFQFTDREELKGKFIELYRDDGVKFGTEVRSGIRLRVAPANAKPTDEPPF